MINPQTAGRRILDKVLSQTGQQVTLAEVSWELADGETEESPIVVGRQDGVDALVEQRNTSRVAEMLGVRLEGAFHAVIAGSATVTEETVVKVTAGNFTGRYFRVAGIPAEPMGHHWELALEPVDPGDRVREEDVLA